MSEFEVGDSAEARSQYESIPRDSTYTSDANGGYWYRIEHTFWPWSVSLPYHGPGDDEDEDEDEDEVEREYLIDAGKAEDVLDSITDLIKVLQAAAEHLKKAAADDAAVETAHGSRSTCGTCDGGIHYIEYTAWNGLEVDVLDAKWSHLQHPADGHDAVLGGPA
jgi:hypothetical protein